MIGRPKREGVSTTITQDRNNRQGLAANPEGSDQTSGAMELADTDGHSAWPNRSKTSWRQGYPTIRITARLAPAETRAQSIAEHP